MDLSNPTAEAPQPTTATAEAPPAPQPPPERPPLVGILETPETSLTTDGGESKGLLPANQITLDLARELPRVITLTWQITGIYVPARALVNLAASGAVLKVLQVTANTKLALVHNGIVEWFQEESRVLHPNAAAGEHEGGPEYQQGGWIFAGDLTNPILMFPGDKLKIQLETSYSARGEEGSEPNNMNAVTSLDAGVLHYLINPRG